MRTKNIACWSMAVLCSASPGRLQGAAEEPELDQIVFRPHAGLVVDKRFERTSVRTVESVTSRRGDEEKVEEPDQHLEGSRTIVLRDTYETDFHASPFVIERSFDELSDRKTQAEADVVIDSTSPFEERTVRLSWNRRENEVSATFVDERDGDEENVALLEGLTPIADLTCFLPDDAVAVGSTWDVSFDSFKWDVLKPGGELGWESDPPNAAASWLQQRTWRALTGDIEAEYVRRLDTDDGRIAVIEFRGTYSSSPVLDVPDDGRLPRRFEVDYEAEGEVRWDLERDLPRSLTMSARETSIETYEAVREAPEENMTVEFRYAGTSEQTFTFE